MVVCLPGVFWTLAPFQMHDIQLFNFVSLSGYDDACFLCVL